MVLVQLSAELFAVLHDQLYSVPPLLSISAQRNTGFGFFWEA
jgi:hypothetical protein